MSYKYVIDSSAWIDYLGGTSLGAKLKRIIEEETIATSVLAIAEIADKCERDERPFEKFLQYIQSRAAILPITINIAVHAAKLKKQIRVKNQKFGLADAMHLATACEWKAILVTIDNDFRDIDDATIVE